MNSIEIICPLCSNKMSVQPEQSGTQVTCPACQKLVTVPNLAPTAAVAAPPAAQAAQTTVPQPQYNQIAPNPAGRRIFKARKRIPVRQIISVSILVLIACFAVLYTYSKADNKTQKEDCRKKLEKIAQALQMYAEVNKGYLPDGNQHKAFDSLLLGGYMGENITRVTSKDRNHYFKCPSAKEDRFYVYLGGNKDSSLCINDYDCDLPILICFERHKTVHIVTNNFSVKSFEISSDQYMSIEDYVRELESHICIDTDSKQWQYILKNAKHSYL